MGNASGKREPITKPRVILVGQADSITNVDGNPLTAPSKKAEPKIGHNGQPLKPALVKTSSRENVYTPGRAVRFNEDQRNGNSVGFSDWSSSRAGRTGVGYGYEENNLSNGYSNGYTMDNGYSSSIWGEPRPTTASQRWRKANMRVRFLDMKPKEEDIYTKKPRMMDVGNLHASENISRGSQIRLVKSQSVIAERFESESDDMESSKTSIASASSITLQKGILDPHGRKTPDSSGYNWGFSTWTDDSPRRIHNPHDALARIEEF